MEQTVQTCVEQPIIYVCQDEGVAVCLSVPPSVIVCVCVYRICQEARSEPLPQMFHRGLLSCHQEAEFSKKIFGYYSYRCSNITQIHPDWLRLSSKGVFFFEHIFSNHKSSFRWAWKFAHIFSLGQGGKATIFIFACYSAISRQIFVKHFILFDSYRSCPNICYYYFQHSRKSTYCAIHSYNASITYLTRPRPVLWREISFYCSL